ncbi:hypothetical protein NQZ68_014765 [Dissostichus eleginoides]|nr:hypothetical protein NQZ68_014765 [Dissostichus eleginoides]
MARQQVVSSLLMYSGEGFALRIIFLSPNLGFAGPDSKWRRNEMRRELTGRIQLPTGTGTLSGETQPQCMLGRRGVMTEKNLELLQGQPADTAD